MNGSFPKDSSSVKRNGSEGLRARGCLAKTNRTVEGVNGALVSFSHTGSRPLVGDNPPANRVDRLKIARRRRDLL